MIGTLSLLLAVLVGGVVLAARQAKGGPTRPHGVRDGMTGYRLRVALRRLFRRADTYEHIRDCRAVIVQQGAPVASLAAELEGMTGTVQDLQVVGVHGSDRADLVIYIRPAETPSEELDGLNHGR